MNTYLIIGGASGIGAETVKILSENHSVIATYNSTQPVYQHTNVTYHQWDVLQENTIDFVEKVDGIVYCPGSINLKPFRKFTSEDFINDFNLHVVGATKIIQSLYSKLRKGNHASIVFFSTVAVQKGFNFHSQVATSKGAIEGLTKALAAEFAPHIRVNAIAPSITQTPLAENLLSSPEKIEANAKLHPLKSIGEPKDIAEMVTYLLSEKAKWITGQILHIDGGKSSLTI